MFIKTLGTGSSGSKWALYDSQQPDTVPLKLYWSNTRTDNALCVTSDCQSVYYVRTELYYYVRTEGFVYASQQPGTIPLKLYWNSAYQDNLLCAGSDCESLHYGSQFVRIEGYACLLPARCYESLGGHASTEGNVVQGGDNHGGLTLDGCQAACDAAPTCRSFTWGAYFGGCYLKDQEHASTSSFGNHVEYVTIYQTACPAPPSPPPPSRSLAA